MSRKRKTLAAQYEDPSQPGALGGVRPFAQAHNEGKKEEKKILSKILR